MEDKEFQKFFIQIQAQNLGFSPVKNVKVKVIVDKGFKVILPTDQEGKFSKSHELTYPSLASLESNVWKLIVEVPTNKWKDMNSGSVIGKNQQSFLTLESDRYPLLSSSEKNTRVLSVSSIVAASGYHPEKIFDVSLLYYLFFGFIILVFVFSFAIYWCMKRKSNGRIDLEGRKHKELELGMYRANPVKNDDKSQSSSD